MFASFATLSIIIIYLMKVGRRKLLTTLFTLLILVTYVHTVIYNQALSTTAGGTAAVTSSAPFATGYEANWAIDGVVTFCNDATNCPGPHLNKMF
jgi:hypothetical protein